MKLILKGLAASPGTVRGKVRVILPTDDPSQIKEGEILVTTLTDPSMVSAMISAAAIVTDIGGMTSHPAILSREMGIPSVVNTKEATRVLKTGMDIVVDGTKGEIYSMSNF